MADRLPPWKVDVANTDAIAKTIRTKESGEKYDAPPNSGGASGAYQFTAPTWQSLTRKYGEGTQYSQAYQAPPYVQDSIAKRYISEIFIANGGDIVSIPYTWYVGNPAGTWKENGQTMTPDKIPKGNKISVNDYAKSWLGDYIKISGQSPPQGPLAGIIGAITNPGDTIANAGGGIAEGAASVVDSLSFFSTLWGALINRDNWIRVGMVIGALLLAIWGMLFVSKSLGGPGASDIASVATKGAV